MDQYTKLQNDATACGLIIVEKKFKSSAKGMIKGNKIGIKQDQPLVEKICALSEEVGHHLTAVGDFTDQTKLENRKKERLGRAWAYERLVPLEKIIAAGQAGVEGRHDVAEWLEVTEQFLQDSIEHYQRKHGLYTVKSGYLIYFDPLSITKL